MKTCPLCLFHENKCLGHDESQRVRLPLRLIFVMNKSEYFKLSNSARIFPLKAYPCELRLRGLKETPFSYEDFSTSLQGEHNFLLYPSEDSEELDLEHFVSKTKEKVNLIIPDGNWAQAAKIARKLKSQGNITPVAFKAPPKSQYKLRNNPNSDRISTFEASFLAIEKLLSPNEKETLLKAFEKLVGQVMKLRGKE